MRHTLARCRHDEIKKAHLPFPTLPLFAAWLHWALDFDKTPTFLSMRPIRCAKEQSERIYIPGVMSDCHPMNGSVRLQTHIGWVRTLQVAYPDAPPMPARVTRGR